MAKALDDLTREEAIKQIREMHEKIGRMRQYQRIVLSQNMQLKKQARALYKRFVQERGWA